MEDLREKDPRATAREDLTDLLVLIWQAVRRITAVTAAVQALMRVVTAALAIKTAAVQAMTDREIDSQITSRAKALWQKLLQRIWKRNVKKTRDVSVRRRISAPKKICSTKRKKY